MSKQQKSSWFEVKPGQHKPKLLRNGAIFAIFLTLSVYIMYFRPPLPVFGAKGEEITAVLGEGTNIRPGFTPVRVAGITVGQVTKLDELAPGQGFKITMEIDDGTNVGTVHKDATAVARWRTLLGRNIYIDLKPGSKASPELSGPIPRNQTGGQIELDEAIDVFDQPGRDSLGNIITAFNQGFGDPAGVRTAVRAVEPAMKNLAPALEALNGQQPRDLTSLVQQTSRAMGALARDEKAFAGLIDQGAIALGVTNANRAALGGTLRGAPGALRQTRSTMVRLRTTLDTLDPTAAELRPGVRVLDEAAKTTSATLRRATPLLIDARPTFRDLAPAVRSARTAAKSGTPAIQSFQPIMDRFKNTLIPWFGETDEETKRKNFQIIGPTLGSVSALVAKGDRNGALATFQAGGGDNFFGGLSPCTQKLFDEFAEPGEKLKCEVLANAITAIFEGRPPIASRYSKATVPASILDPLFKGKINLKQATDLLGKNLDKATTAGKRGGR